MEDRTKVIAGSAIVITSLGIALGVALTVGGADNPLRRAWIRLMNGPEGTPPSPAVLQRFADSREYRRRDTPPQGAREIPIVAAARRELSPGLGRQSWARSRDACIAALAAIRSALRAADSQIDPRCAMVLWSQETGYGRSCWNGNPGNAKCRPDSNPAMILERQRVWTTIAEPQACYLLVDRGGSFDSYYDFPSLDRYATYFVRAVLQPPVTPTVRRVSS